MATQNFRVKNGIEVGTGVTINSTSGLLGNVVGDINSSGVSTFNTLKVGSNVTINSGIVTAHGASIDNIRIGITNDNTIDTNSDGLILDSSSGTVTINDQLSVSGVSTFITRVAIGTDSFAESIDLDGILLVKRDTGLARVRVRNNGSSSTDYASFNLKTGVADWSLYTNGATNYFRIYDVVAGEARVHIDSSGNVGINSTSPTQSLDVGGTTKTQQLNVTGVSTFAGITTVTGPTLFSKQLNVSGVSTFAGITNVTGSTLFANQLSVSGVSTITTLEGTTLKNYGETINNIGNTGTAATINLANGNFVTATLTDNCTFTFTTGLSSGAISFTLLLTNDATPGRSIVWPPTVKWPGSSVPTRTTSANATDIYTFFTLNNGTNWYGSLSLYNYA